MGLLPNRRAVSYTHLDVYKRQGQHRWEAINELKKAGEDYEAYFILPLTDQYDLMTILKEANTSVNPWDGIALTVKVFR